MNDKIKYTFDEIRAEQQLKRDTIALLREKINQGSQKNHRTRQSIFVLAGFCLIIFTCVFFYQIYFIEAMYVDMDINPSIELAINRLDRVIGVYAYNDSGEELLSQLKLMHMPYDAAVATLTKSAVQKGFLSDGGLVSVTLQAKYDDINGVLLETLKDYISSAAQELRAFVQIDAFSVDGGIRKHAHEQNLTPAKYLAILELQEIDPKATVNSCRNHSISEIRALTEEHKGNHHDKEYNSAQPYKDSTHHRKSHH